MSDAKIVDLGGVKDTMRRALLSERADAFRTSRQLIEQAGWDAQAMRKFHEDRDLASCKQRLKAAVLTLARLSTALDHEAGIPDEKPPEGLTPQERMEWCLREDAADARARSEGRE